MKILHRLTPHYSLRAVRARLAHLGHRADRRWRLSGRPGRRRPRRIPGGPCARQAPGIRQRLSCLARQVCAHTSPLYFH